jgi:acetyl-CoA carboxylase biotin carboxylase subunit
MRVVESSDELEGSLKLARSEALSAFGDDSLFIEKFLSHPRHIEFQIMADSQGGCVWLGERECSVQRRHQKIVEETPSPALDDDLRESMGNAAARLASAAGYSGAGTVEFLLEEGKFYFLEVNARLQVEHPVTEMVTGRDLVADQLRIAAGEPLGYEQEDIKPVGNSIEVRIYAEDPDNNFFPSPGIVDHLEPPSGPGIRHDCGITVGSEVTLHYDPLISKLVAWAPDRSAMINRMIRALAEYQITGVTTIIPFLREILAFDSFKSGNYTTQIVPEMMEGRESGGKEMAQNSFYAAVAGALFHDSRRNQAVRSGGGKPLTGSGRNLWVEKGRELREWRR